ncbi:hypothetical protein M407DRAFT_35056 [Tulasnella calospora MUT 4182]|uniref:Uncharacterized protein n=1 Tax=Tulasnella calospora MUT 4182 TaxID=1051891 RepID=A0A0C3PM48_9AGAM|nr:hypothetical protein M407DRAFT_35056 [Tulasnella calospora MUT 4182]
MILELLALGPMLPRAMVILLPLTEEKEEALAADVLSVEPVHSSPFTRAPPVVSVAYT